MTYFEEVTKAQAMLAKMSALFIGQSMRYPSNAMFKTLRDVPMEQRIEVPVFEDVQMGLCIGYALGCFLSVCCFPRMDFLLLAANQLVNHLDKLPYTQHRAKVIIRTSVGATYPLHSGHQHTQDHTAAFRLMLRHVEVIDLLSKWEVADGYRHAAEMEGSCLIVERQDLYNEE